MIQNSVLELLNGVFDQILMPAFTRFNCVSEGVVVIAEVTKFRRKVRVILVCVFNQRSIVIKPGFVRDPIEVMEHLGNSSQPVFSGLAVCSSAEDQSAVAKHSDEDLCGFNRTVVFVSPAHPIPAVIDHAHVARSKAVQ